MTIARNAWVMTGPLVVWRSLTAFCALSAGRRGPCIGLSITIPTVPASTCCRITDGRPGAAAGQSGALRASERRGVWRLLAAFAGRFWRMRCMVATWGLKSRGCPQNVWCRPTVFLSPMGRVDTCRGRCSVPTGPQRGPWCTAFDKYRSTACLQSCSASDCGLTAHGIASFIKCMVHGTGQPGS